MYLIGLSTPDCARVCVEFPNHKILCKYYAVLFEGYSVWYNSVQGPKYIGYFSNGNLIKV